jgi:hypothetical protein
MEAANSGAATKVGVNQIIFTTKRIDSEKQKVYNKTLNVLSVFFLISSVVTLGSKGITAGLAMLFPYPLSILSPLLLLVIAVLIGHYKVFTQGVIIFTTDGIGLETNQGKVLFPIDELSDLKINYNAGSITAGDSVSFGQTENWAEFRFAGQNHRYQFVVATRSDRDKLLKIVSLWNKQTDPARQSGESVRSDTDSARNGTT